MLGVSLVSLLASAPGQTWFLSQFTGTFIEEFGLSPSAFNAGFSAVTLLASLPMIVLGSMMDRAGLRISTMLSAIGVAVAGAVTAFATGAVFMLAGVLLLRLTGQGTLGMVSGHVLAKWYRERLGSMEGIRHAVNGAFIAAASPLVVLLIDAVGWRTAMLVCAGVCGGVVVVLTLTVFRESPESIGQEVDGGPVVSRVGKARRRGVEHSLTLFEALRTRAYWAVMLTPFIAVTASSAIVLNIQPMMAESGVERAQAAFLITVFAGVNVPLQFIVGWLVDRTPSWFPLVLGNAGLIAGCLLMTGRSEYAVAVAGMAGMAVCHGALWSSNSALLVRFFGLDHQGALRGSLTTLIVLATSAGPLLVSGLYSLTGGYNAALLAFAGFGSIVLVLGALLRDPVLPSDTPHEDAGGPASE